MRSQAFLLESVKNEVGCALCKLTVELSSQKRHNLETEQTGEKVTSHACGMPCCLTGHMAQTFPCSVKQGVHTTTILGPPVQVRLRVPDFFVFFP